MPARLLGDPLNLMTNPTRDFAESRFSRRAGLSGFAALVLGTYWFRRPNLAEARSAAPSSYCFQQCAQDVGDEYANTLNNCGSEADAYAQVGCLLVAYLGQRSGLKKCGTFYCGDPKRYPPPKPPPPPPAPPPPPPPPAAECNPACPPGKTCQNGQCVVDVSSANCFGLCGPGTQCCPSCGQGGFCWPAETPCRC